MPALIDSADKLATTSGSSRRFKTQQSPKKRKLTNPADPQDRKIRLA
jgi:hypothetical protein